MNYKIILHTLGWVLNIEAAALVLPLICALIYGENTVGAFAVTIVLCLIFGLASTIKAPKNKAMYAKEGFVSVALAWIILSIFGALPFVFSGSIPSFINAVFETASGFTTTGASILTDVETLPKSMLFWRSFTHWLGGMGVLVFLVALLPLSGSNNLYLIKAESPGPAVSKLVPKVRTTAKILYKMYVVLTVIMVIFLLFGGFNLFEALTIAFGTAGTGGFGILNNSCTDYSPYIQVVITVFMVLFGIDFSLYYLLLLGKARDVLRSEELRSYLGIILFSIILITVNCRDLFLNLSDTIRHAAFQVASIITTSGFATTDFDKWPEFSKVILVLLTFCGACAGSTGGGIKVSRIVILFKSIKKELVLLVHPHGTRKITMNSRPVEHEVVRGVNVYMAAYLLIFAASILLVSLDNFDFTTNFTAVATTLNNVGPGLAGVGPTSNFFDFSVLSKLVFTADMLIGRLEIFPFLVLFSPAVRRK